MPFVDETMTVDRDIYLCIPLYQLLGDEIGMFRDTQDSTPWSSAKVSLNVEGVSGIDSTQIGRMQKLFFPLPMHTTVTESEMQQVY